MKNKIASVLFIILALLVMGAAWYLVYNYLSGAIGAIVDFVTSSDYGKLQQCGVTPPTAFTKIKADFAGIILPAIYLGIPVVLLFVSYLMFMAGFFWHKAKLEDEAKKREMMEREMVHKIVNKMQTDKPSQPSRPAPMKKAPPKMEAAEEEESETEEPAEETEEPAEEETEEESEPPPKPMMKKKK